GRSATAGATPAATAAHARTQPRAKRWRRGPMGASRATGLLAGCHLLDGRLRAIRGRRAYPGMLREIEDDTIGAAEFRLEVGAGHRRVGLHEAGRSHLLKLPGEFLDIVDEDAEMMDAGIIETAAELIDVLKFEDREV